MKAVFILLLSALIVCSLTGCWDHRIQVAAEPQVEQNPEIHLVPLTLAEASQISKKVTRNYSWDFNGVEWHWTLRIPVSFYDYFREITRPDTKDYSIYVTHPMDDKCIEKLVVEINRIAEKYSFDDSEKIHFVSTFVQNLQYTLDSETTLYEDYPRYPIETLFDLGGDCEDTAILLGSILDKMGYDIVMVLFPQTKNKRPHYGIGVALNGAYGTNWEHNGGKYYYLETTRVGWKIGAISGSWSNVSPALYELQPAPFLVSSWTAIEESGISQVEVSIENIGTAGVNSVYIEAIVYSEDADSLLDDLVIIYSYNSSEFSLYPNDSKLIRLELPYSLHEQDFLSIQVIYSS
jgi:predicted transglutaminase-like cysteine proteinase